MEIKHKECFTPMFIKHFGLQAVSKYARETWDFVNLYSKTRGANRFPALSRALNLLRERRETTARKVAVPSSAPIDDWMGRESKLSNAMLAQEVKLGREELAPTLAWSNAVNAMIEDIVHGVPPFPLFRESLLKMNERADTMVVSQTPTEALQREWAEHDIDQLVRLIAGQELGTKTEHLKFGAAGKYPAEKILMIGDAPGDFKAAQANKALFYPINPGDEEASWQRFYEEGLGRFFAGTFAGEYQAGLMKAFDARLPEKPSW